MLILCITAFVLAVFIPATMTVVNIRRDEKKMRRQYGLRKKQTGPQSANISMVGYIGLTDADIFLIKTEGIERAAELMAIHPVVLVRSLKVKFAKQGD